MKRIIISIFLILQVLAGTANNTSDLDSVFSGLWNLKFLDNTGRGLIMARSFTFSAFRFDDNIPFPKPGGFADEASLVCFITDNLDRVCRTADESYRFESHKVGKDTIMYSICVLLGQTSVAQRYGSRVFYEGAKEAVSFEYFGDSKKNHSNGYLNYTSVVNPMSKDVEPFNVKAYEDEIKPILEHPCVSVRSVEWSHDENTPKDEYILTSEVRRSGHPKTSSGTSTGLLYTIPTDSIALADSILRSLCTETMNYLYNHTDQNFRYNFSEDYPYRYLSNMLTGFCGEPDDVFNVSFQTFSFLDDEGYHILTLKTSGALWVPKWLINSFQAYIISKDTVDTTPKSIVPQTPVPNIGSSAEHQTIYINGILSDYNNLNQIDMTNVLSVTVINGEVHVTTKDEGPYKLP